MVLKHTDISGHPVDLEEKESTYVSFQRALTRDEKFYLATIT